jgi:hypothetical protein
MRIHKKFRAPAAVLGILIAVALGAEPTEVVRGTFDSDGAVHFPAQYRQWVHVGTRVKVGGKNILDGSDLKSPQILNSFVEPSAMAVYERTGQWPEGSQIVKQISAVKMGNGCEAATGFCTNDLGTGFFEDSLTGLGMMVKDSKRFPSQPGHWGYFGFFRRDAWDQTAQARPQEQCAACHVKFASATDYVIVQAHLGLAPSNTQ